MGLIQLMLRPAGLFGLALLALFAVTMVKLWREGAFESFRVKAAASVPVADKGWMLGDKVRPPIEKNATIVPTQLTKNVEAEQSGDGAEDDNAE